MGIKILFIGLLLFGQACFAELSCLPTRNALQLSETVSVHQPHIQTYLLNKNQTNRQWTETELTYSADGAGTLSMVFKFEDRFDGVSLPYNIFAILVLANGKPVIWKDLTEQCQTPPVGIFPGQRFQVPLGKIPDSSANLQIIVW